MDNAGQNHWLSITAYVVISLSVLTLLLLFVDTYFPDRSSNLMPRQNPPAAADRARQQNLFFRLGQEKAAGKALLVYRGLVGSSEFQIDVIIPELDPHVSYPYRFKISEAKKSLRLANRNYRLITARRAALQLESIQ